MTRSTARDGDDPNDKKPESMAVASLLDQAEDYFLTLDAGFCITSLNQAYRHVLGDGVEAALGRNVWEVFPDYAGTEYEKRTRAAMLLRQADRFEGLIGEGNWFRTHIFPVQDGLGILSIDVTDRHRIEEELRTANRIKDEFLATLSHELRTPLNSIVGWVHLLRSGSLDDEGTTRGLDTIERSARAQAKLIDDLLDVSRIISGKLSLEIQPTDPSEAVEAALAMVAPAAAAKQITLEKSLDPSGPLQADPARLQQVLWNLLANAVKFTPRGGKVEVRLRRTNGEVAFRVTDTGQGIQPEFLPHVFDLFRQADSSTTRRHSGLGLGLSIVRELVEMHGGTVTVESAGDNRGTAFTVTLPIRS